MQMTMRCLLIFLIVGVSGCGPQTAHIARATKLPEETQGFARLVNNKEVKVIRRQWEDGEKGGKLRLNQEKSNVNIVGEKVIVQFKVADPVAYFLVHEQDIAVFVKNTRRLQLIKQWLKTNAPDKYKVLSEFVVRKMEKKE